MTGQPDDWIATSIYRRRLGLNVEGSDERHDGDRVERKRAGWLRLCVVNSAQPVHIYIYVRTALCGPQIEPPADHKAAMKNHAFGEAPQPQSRERQEATIYWRTMVKLPRKSGDMVTNPTKLVTGHGPSDGQPPPFCNQAHKHNCSKC